MLAHTLGNPFDLDAVSAFCRQHNLWLIEDNCDALGATYKGRYTGTFGDIATSSFYPPHHITMGEGGAVYTNNKDLTRIIESMRDWGRDCWCPSGKDNTCGKRFEHQLGELPFGYDHKYTYSEFGYNLKASDMTAALKDPPELIKEFLSKWEEGYENVYGIVTKRPGTGLARRFNSQVFYWLINTLTGGVMPKNVSDFRLVDKKVYQTINGMAERNRYLRGLFVWAGFRSIGIEFERAPRFAGKSKAYTLQVIELALKGIFAYSYVPIKLITIMRLNLNLINNFIYF